MEETLISIEAIDKEIKLCEELISDPQVNLTELIEQQNAFTNRLNVLNAVEKRLSAGGTKLLNSNNIKMLVEENTN